MIISMQVQRNTMEHHLINHMNTTQNKINMLRIIILTMFIAVAILASFQSCREHEGRYDSGFIVPCKRISKTWKLEQMLKKGILEKPCKNEWILQLKLSGDSYSTSINVLGEPEAQLGKWILVDNGSILQISNYFISSTPFFISTWYKIIRLTDDDLWLESVFDTYEQFHFKAVEVE